MRGRYTRTEEHRAFSRAINLGRKATEEARASMRAAAALKTNAPYWLGRKQSKEHIAKRVANSVMPKGKEHHWWGVAPHPASGNGKGSYSKKGHWTRSTWERRFADWLFDSGIQYEYEKTRFAFEECTYVPDFFIPSLTAFVELKGRDGVAPRRKAALLKSTGAKVIYITKQEWQMINWEAGVEQLVKWEI